MTPWGARNDEWGRSNDLLPYRLTALPPYRLTALPPYRLTASTALPAHRETAESAIHLPNSDISTPAIS